MTATQAASAVHPLADISVTLRARRSTLSTHRSKSRYGCYFIISQFAFTSFAGKMLLAVIAEAEVHTKIAANPPIANTLSPIRG